MDSHSHSLFTSFLPFHFAFAFPSLLRLAAEQVARFNTTVLPQSLCLYKDPIISVGFAAVTVTTITSTTTCTSLSFPSPSETIQMWGLLSMKKPMVLPPTSHKSRSICIKMKKRMTNQFSF
ncbi:uncharacterized protein LOC129299379 [Prosopis cineraria]|uniref:uncharacterized protein LOC129299379 n=1 Tax=Prosopis cineraria TaxID=364024 RepID=UPI002410462D|nr:uncharacterized protein LOC129299379 [Prosopis cineraria]